MEAEPDDADLVRRARGGEQDAFEQLYRSHVGKLYAFCLRLVGNPAEAEEMTQETFVRAWKSLAKLETGAHLKAWLYRVAINLRLNQLRRRRRWGDPLEFDAERTAAGPGPRGPAVLRVDLEHAIAALPNGARTVLVLHDVYGYKHREIAGLLGVRVGTSKAHLHRARRKLREVFHP